MIDQSALLETLLETIRDAVVVCDAERRLVRVNKAFEVMTGHSTEGLVEGDDRFASVARKSLLEAVSAKGGRWQGNVACVGGTEKAVVISTSAVNGPGTDFPCYYLGLVRLAADAARDTGEQRFGHDQLTGLPNRDIFGDRVDRAVLTCNRVGGSVALLMMGLDRFTMVNDALGHAAGDRLLIEVSNRLRHCIRETDTVVRLDGDKFAMVMTIADMDDSVIVAEKVLHSIKQPFAMDGQEVVVTFSIGIALFPQDAPDASGLVKQAENALHHAKVSGRNQYQFFSKDMNRKAKVRLDLESRMRRALVNEEFTVFYQPKVSADDDRLVGAEALVRWIDPDKGMIGPGEFIPVAEETGLIEQIGSWVLRRSCEQTIGWQKMGLSPVKVSVNVSARQFRSRAFIDIVTGVLGDTGLDPKWLELEITESMLMNDVESAVRKMGAIRDLGVGLSIDDFGTGYSSLSYLGRFPITTLKIDRAFIADVDTNPKTAEIARAIIGLSQGLNLEVVAEGCEISEHVAFLKEHGCSTIQGYYYSKPVPAEQFQQMLQAGRVPRPKD
ncbi:EAL domain-containing protein [Magnetospirillum moscoviense]|uniref:Signal transduction protein n=1 Tax=Magnetospirillum moscoviense TaxID=1437059 RepID=A0A178MYM0_9PROT|nr:EAL domain-containing protein [Magnetospirillum moscoviense]MBF0324844.1 EAL domain-containing protein [Alphaproteobacteria bacterium]OAN63219.1 signal transduction protein [Magnetospirillum moscoviense]